MRETALELGEPEEEEYDVYDFWPSLQIVVAAREESASSYDVSPLSLSSLPSELNGKPGTIALPARYGIRRTSQGTRAPSTGAYASNSLRIRGLMCCASFQSLVTFENIVDYRFDPTSKPSEGGQDEDAQAASVVATPGYSPLFRLGLLFTIASANGLRDRMTVSLLQSFRFRSEALNVVCDCEQKMRRRLGRVLRKLRARILRSRAP